MSGLQPMTKKLFWKDPYCTEHDTIVSWSQGDQIKLAETILFAFSGGQESDCGTIDGLQVRGCRKEGLDIVYSLDPDHGLVAGQQVRVELDWERRYRLMRLHFAAELVLELFYRELPGVEKVGAHISTDKARLDFAWPESISPRLPAFAEQANRIIAADLEIRTGFDDVACEKRYWEIEGFSRVPCGGTHVHSTGEIGPIRLKRNNIGKGKERVEIYLQGD